MVSLICSQTMAFWGSSSARTSKNNYGKYNE